ncbi:transcriptional regulator [Streptomyces sp. NPDC047046]|uniref:transcriptional regulator n=1 Tax=Streptomyces sp. NPDC047046 TaxID=3155378 RepID=UPI0033FFCEFA
MTALSDATCLRRERFARRLPTTLADLTGPRHGTVRLPPHLAWSGLTAFDLDRPRLRMSCYRIVIGEAGRDDICRYLDRTLLLALWPTLRTLISRDIREVWEDAFPELGPAVRKAV